ncbi:reverse transcriptase [Gossypium australe]|uniref:Reverse transcriptase n=1 Tax=Gossypium australe TaxID=47621 RepID=A0A5B6VDL5_9ROSI|nr:reverse transcriptase [Gossypium australe]
MAVRISTLSNGLKRWAGKIKQKRGRDVKRLTKRLEELNCFESSKESLAELVDKRRTNRIRGLQRSDGSLDIDCIEIGEIACDYFSDLFDSRGIGNLDHILLWVSCCISDSMNQSLTAAYTKEEIDEALKRMGPTKASDPDGFPTIFFQKYWSIIGNDTSDFCLDILNNGRSLDEINSTQLVLIPKTANPLNLKNFRPISLCIVIYKIIAKTVANRLQKVLDACIDDS